jgi:anti-anti-sigma regulatory factor
VSVIHIGGDLNTTTEQPLMRAFAAIDRSTTRAILLDFTQLEYMKNT